MDFHMVMLGMRDHKLVFTKDMSKFYQCVEADEISHHVHRVLLRLGDTSWKGLTMETGQQDALP
jgi:hypothetical protein